MFEELSNQSVPDLCRNYSLNTLAASDMMIIMGIREVLSRNKVSLALFIHSLCSLRASEVAHFNVFRIHTCHVTMYVMPVVYTA